MERWRELLRDYKDAKELKEYFRNVLKGVVPQETLSNTMGVGGVWKPHNFRLKFILKKNIKPILVGLDTKSEIERVVGVLPLEFRLCNHNSKLFLWGLDEDVMVEVNPKSIQLVYTGEMWFKIDFKGDFEGFMDWKVAEIRDRLLGVLNRLNLRDLVVWDSECWVRQENSLRGEEFLDALPKGLVLDTPFFKKVYDDTGEFKGADFVKAYVRNRVLEDFSGYEPRLRALERVVGGLDLVKSRIGCVEDVLAERDRIVVLSDTDKFILTEWLFSTDFGRGRVL